MTRTVEELQGEMARALHGHVKDPEPLAAKILDAFARITDAEVRHDVPGFTELITLDRHSFSGVSVKAGNIRLNWRMLFEKTPELVLTGAGVTQVWLIPFAALYLWNLIRSLSKISISPDHGMVMYALWSTGQDTRRFDEPTAHSIVNDFRATYGLAAFDKVNFGNLLSALARLGCIEITEDRIWLREWTQRTN